MKKLERSALVPYSAEQMFALVNDIEAYPQYMKGCRHARILKRSDNEVTARLDLEQAGLRQSFTTRNELEPGKSMTMHLVEGPFKHFEGLWQFHSLDASSCKLTFNLEYQFANRLLGFAANRLMSNMANEQVDAVCRRARTVYGAA